MCSSAAVSNYLCSIWMRDRMDFYCHRSQMHTPIRIAFIADWSLWLFAASNIINIYFDHFVIFMLFKSTLKMAIRRFHEKFIHFHCDRSIDFRWTTFRSIHTRIGIRFEKVAQLAQYICVEMALFICHFQFFVFSYCSLCLALSRIDNTGFVPHKSFNCSTWKNVAQVFLRQLWIWWNCFCIYRKRNKRAINLAHENSKWKASTNEIGWLHLIFVCGSVH